MVKTGQNQTGLVMVELGGEVRSQRERVGRRSSQKMSEV